MYVKINAQVMFEEKKTEKDKLYFQYSSGSGYSTSK